MVIDSQNSRTITKNIQETRNASSSSKSSSDHFSTDISISLTKEEKDLFELLKDVAECYNDKTVLRVVSGLFDVCILIACTCKKFGHSF